MHGTLSIKTLLCASLLHPFIGRSPETSLHLRHTQTTRLFYSGGQDSEVSMEFEDVLGEAASLAPGSYERCPCSSTAMLCFDSYM